MAALFAGLLALAAPGVSRGAPAVRVWTPTGIDSITSWAVQARTAFRANTGDSLGGSNFQAYLYAGRIGRHLLSQLGRGNMTQAYAVEPVIDSLGLDTEIAVDPAAPYFAMLSVRNPFNLQADVVGFLYWFQGNDLRFQGVRLTSGRSLGMRVWRTADSRHPWSWGVLENTRHASLPVEFTLLRLSTNGMFWTADQFPGNGIELGGRGDATFADLNNDGVPELVSWTQAGQDSTFLPCETCPRLISERTWTERDGGFELLESRVMPSAFATFVTFTRFLREGSRAAALRLVASPALVDQAITQGWDKVSGKNAWRITGVERNETWPHWIVVRHGRGAEAKGWVVNFVFRDGRWIIQDWVREKVTTPPQVQAR